MSDTVHYDEVLQDLIDGRLTSDVETEVRAHVSSCSQCQSGLRALEAGRAAAVSLRQDLTIPAGLASSIGAALDDEDRRSVRAAHGSRESRETRWSITPWAAFVGAAAVVVLVVAIWWRLPVDIPAHALRDFESVIAGAVPIEVTTGSASKLEEYFAQTIRPRIRVIDLAMMGFALEGGRRHAIGSRPSALYVYRGASGDRIVCQMFPGGAADLPASDDVRESAGIRFHVLRQGDVTLVFWLEGDIVCVLVSRIPADDLVKLAFAKAMRPA